MNSPPHTRPLNHDANTRQAFIRGMTPADVDAVFELERATAEAPHWPRRDYESAIAAAPDDALLMRTALAAEIDGHIAGFVVIRRLRLPASHQPEQIHCELESIVVASHLRGHGMGLRLMNAVLDHAASTGADRLELEVRASNQPAIRLYTRAGLTPQGHRPNYYSDPLEDALLMSINLDHSAGQR